MSTLTSKSLTVKRRRTVGVKINRSFWQLTRTRARYVVCYGGRRSGKSYAVSQLLVRKALSEAGRRIVVMRKVARTIRLSVWPRVIAAVDEAVGIDRCYVNKSDFTIRLPNGSEFLFVGADNPEKLKSLESATDYWFEEASEFDAVDLDTIDAGLSPADVQAPAQVWLTFNPLPRIPGAEHWLQRRFLQTAHEIGEMAERGEVAVLRTTFMQNAYVPEATREVLLGYRESNPELWRLWGLGEFTTLEGAILTQGVEVIREGDIESLGLEYVGRGQDFGYANDPAALVSIWSSDRALALREDLYETGLTNRDLSARYGELGVSYREVIRADSAEPKSIDELRADGWLVVPAEKGPDYKRAAARWLQSKRIYVVEGSTNLLRELASWSWDRDRSGNLLPRPADGDDHTVDATIYGAYRRENVIRSLI